MNLKAKFAAVTLVVIASVTILAGCTTAATPQGACGWIVGNGAAGNDRKIHETVYENENPDISEGEIGEYVPCGPRNFRVTDGSVKDTDDKAIGDQTTPFLTYTKTGTAINVQVTAYWQLNQDKAAFTDFYTLCAKYTCARPSTDQDTSQDTNSSTKGWLNMLNENFAPAMLRSVAAASEKLSSDDIWKKHSQAEYDALATEVSANFAENIRLTTGYNEDLFCGSGNSKWKNESKHDSFTCSDVRFVITDVEAANAETQKTANADSLESLNTATNKSTYNSAKELYGDDTGYWLGVQDTVKKCPKDSTCVFNLGGETTVTK